MLVQDGFVCSIWGSVPVPFSEYHIWGALEHPGPWIICEVLLNQYSVPNEYAGRGSIIKLRLILFRNVHESQASEHTQMLQRWLHSGSMPGHIRTLADY